MTTMGCCAECDMTTDYQKALKAMPDDALTNLTGADQLSISFGAPREVHWALGGVAASAVMEGQLPGLEIETLKCAAARYAG
ncbi:MAG: hypothetical protein SGPRY_011513, partial [Prymnesium sp.]